MSTTTAPARAPSRVAVRLRDDTIGAAVLVGFGGGGYWLATARNPSLVMLGFLVALAAVGLSAQMWLTREPLLRTVHLVSPPVPGGVFLVSLFWPATSLERTVALLLAGACGVFVSVNLEVARRYRRGLREGGHS